MGHTPGPWGCDGSEIYCENLVIASVHRPKTDDEGGVMSNAEANANASLIAAAPELLAALRELKMLRCLGGCTPENDSPTQRAVLAINKAEGRGE